MQVSDFARWLQTSGFEVQRNQAIDLAVRAPFIIIEAKILPDDTIQDQLRQAVGQLYEYRFFKCGSPEAQLMFLGSRPLPSEWVHYLETDRDITVAWRSSDHFELSAGARSALGL
jgi:hypothetical protein